MPAARQYKPVFLISSRSKIPGMEIAAVAVGALFELTTEFFVALSALGSIPPSIFNQTLMLWEGR